MYSSPFLSYEIMHSCWSPVPKCRPSFEQLVSQLEALWASLSPAPLLKEALLYVNVEGEERERGEGGAVAGAPGPEEPTWGVPWQCGGSLEDGEKDWLMVSSGAAFAIGGDYRYILGPRSTLEEEEDATTEVSGGGRRESMDTLQEELRDEEEDAVINV